MKKSKHQRNAEYLSLIDLGQISNFEIAGSDAGFIQKIHAIRNKCLRDFTAEEVRVCLAQDVGITYLVPKALDLLETNPWIEAEHYEGDLLKTCIDIEGDCWEEVKDARERMRTILEAANGQIEEGSISVGRQEIRDLERGFRKFGRKIEQGGASEIRSGSGPEGGPK